MEEASWTRSMPIQGLLKFQIFPSANGGPTFRVLTHSGRTSAPNSKTYVESILVPSSPPGKTPPQQ